MKKSKTEGELIDSFNQIMDAHKDVQANYTILSEALVSEMAADGVTIQPTDLIKLASFRAAVLANDPELLGPWREEAQRLIPAAVEAVEMKRLAKALQEEDSQEHQAAIDQFVHLSGADKIAKFRALNAAAGPSPSQPAAAPDILSPQEKAKAIRSLQVMSPSRRMAEARRMGLA